MDFLASICICYFILMGLGEPWWNIWNILVILYLTVYCGSNITPKTDTPKDKLPPQPPRCDPIPPPPHPFLPKTLTFSTLQASGYSAQVHDLLSKILLPFRNARIYSNSGQLGDKLPPGLLLTGPKVRVTSFAAALRTELSLSSGDLPRSRPWAQFFLTPPISSFTKMAATRFIRYMIITAIRKAPAILFLEDIHTWTSEFNYLVSTIIAEELRKTAPGQVLLIARAANDAQYRVKGSLKWFLTIRVDIPGTLSVQDRKDLVLYWTWAWDHPVSEDVLEEVARGMGNFPEGTDIELVTPILSNYAYRQCLVRYLEEEGNQDKEINGKDINPTRGDWEVALNQVGKDFEENKSLPDVKKRSTKVIVQEDENVENGNNSPILQEPECHETQDSVNNADNDEPEGQENDQDSNESESLISMQGEEFEVLDHEQGEGMPDV